MLIKPFRAVRPQAELIPEVAALPYDVYSREEAAKVVEGKPLSFLNIDRPETQFGPDFDMYSDAAYEKAKEEFLALGKPKGLSEKFLKYVWKKWADDFYPVKQYPRFGETKIRNLFCKDHEVSRELLLLTVLLKKVIVGGTVQKKSAIIRMLTNCRLSPEFADTVFEKYVEAAFDDMNKEDNGKNTYEERYRRRASRMRILNEQSLEMELSYLKGIYDKDGHLVERGTAVFADAFFGRRIE